MPVRVRLLKNLLLAGLAFALAPLAALASSSEQVLHNFQGGQDGEYPLAAPINVGGKFNEGTIYRLLRNGTEQVVHSFGGAPNDGARPDAE